MRKPSLEDWSLIRICSRWWRLVRPLLSTSYLLCFLGFPSVLVLSTLFRNSFAARSSACHSVSWLGWSSFADLDSFLASRSCGSFRSIDRSDASANPYGNNAENEGITPAEANARGQGFGEAVGKGSFLFASFLPFSSLALFSLSTSPRLLESHIALKGC